MKALKNAGVILVAAFCIGILGCTGGNDGSDASQADAQKGKGNDQGEDEQGGKKKGNGQGTEEGGEQELGIFVELSEEMRQQILQDAAGFFSDPYHHIWRNVFYRSYNDYLVVFVDDSDVGAQIYTGRGSFGLAGIWVITDKPLAVWKDKRFYPVQEAFYSGQLTLGDALNLRAYFQKGQWDGFDVETEQHMLQEYFDNFDLYKPKGREPADRQPVSVEEVWTDTYLGSYNDCVIASFMDDYIYRWDVYRYVIAGIKFDRQNFPPLAWKDGRLYTLQKAYDLGFLTVDDLLNIKDASDKWNYIGY